LKHTDSNRLSLSAKSAKSTNASSGYGFWKVSHKAFMWVAASAATHCDYTKLTTCRS
jgi:hypothetical protein